MKTDFDTLHEDTYQLNSSETNPVQQHIDHRFNLQQSAWILDGRTLTCYTCKTFITIFQQVQQLLTQKMPKLYICPGLAIIFKRLTSL